MDEWVSVTEDMPQIKRGFAHVSVDVVAKLKNGTEAKAFYADNYDRWFYENNCHRIWQDVISWKSIR
jgi:hypothetical protein